MDESGSTGDDDTDEPAAAGLAAVLGQAVDICRSGLDPDGDLIWPLLHDARRFGRPAFDAAVIMLDSADPSERSVGCDMLASLCNPDEEQWGSEVASAVIRIAGDERDRDVLISVASALGHACDQRALPTLVGLAGHADRDVRHAAAVALPSCQEGADPVLLSQALIGLMEDPDPRVRDWAAFGLGTLTELDGPDVRDAFVRRLDDDHVDTRDEAIVGLARRRDRRALAVVDARLREDAVGPMAVEAAAYLADARLLPALHALEPWWDVDPDLLAEAVDRCDPARQTTRLAELRLFSELLAQALADRPDVGAVLCCDRFDRETALDIEHGDRTGRYDVRYLMERAGGYPERAVQILLDGLGAA